MGGSLSILDLRRGKFHLHSHSLSSSLSKVPPVFVLKSFQHSHPFLGKLHSFPWEKRIPEYFWSFHLDTDGGLQEPRLDKHWGWSLWVPWLKSVRLSYGQVSPSREASEPMKPQPPQQQGFCWTAGLLAMPCCSNSGNSWRKHFLGGLNRLPAFFPQSNRGQYWSFEMSYVPLRFTELLWEEAPWRGKKHILLIGKMRG